MSPEESEPADFDPYRPGTTTYVEVEVLAEVLAERRRAVGVARGIAWALRLAGACTGFAAFIAFLGASEDGGWRRWLLVGVLLCVTALLVAVAEGLHACRPWARPVGAALCACGLLAYPALSLPALCGLWSLLRGRAGRACASTARQPG